MSTEDLTKLKIDKSVKVSGPRKRKQVTYGLMGIAALIIFGFLYSKGFLTPPVPIEVVTISEMYPSQSFTLLNSSGYVVAQRKAALASKITGRLVSLSVKEGDKVKEGQVIARLENEDTKANMNQAEANLNMVKANLERDKTELGLAILSYNRNKALFEKGSVSESEYDSAKSKYERAKAAVNASEASIKAAESACESARIAYEYSLIKVPFDAVVLTKNADIGDIITPLGAAANAKAAVITIADMESLQVETDISESNLSIVKVDQPCEIQIDAIPNTRFNGVVQTIVPTADRSKAAVMVKIRFLDNDPRILPEMSAKVAFLAHSVRAEDQKPIIAVNTATIIKRGNLKVIYLVNDKHVIETPVKTGSELGDMTEILEGAKPGSKVAIKPLDKLKNGSKIELEEK